MITEINQQITTDTTCITDGFQTESAVTARAEQQNTHGSCTHVAGQRLYEAINRRQCVIKAIGRALVKLSLSDDEVGIRAAGTATDSDAQRGEMCPPLKKLPDAVAEVFRSICWLLV